VGYLPVFAGACYDCGERGLLALLAKEGLDAIRKRVADGEFDWGGTPSKP